MSELKKATLQEIKSDEAGTPLDAPVEVQFNPTTLRLQINNTVEGGQSQGRQARQFIGASSTTLSLDLIFDTADEGTTDKPRNVREKTALVEKFVLPKGTGQDKQAPPKVRFNWGTLILDGVIDSISLDFDLFAADGTPLRAKVGISIKEQNSKYQFLEAGAGANDAGNAPAPGEASAGSPGSSGGPASSSALAIGGESSAEFAARLGLDPSAWRGLSVGVSGSLSIGVSGSLSLEAGAEIGFSAGLSASAGIGVHIGVEAGVSASLEGSFGLEATAGVSAVAGVGVGAGLAAGFNLSAAGGVSAAIESVKIAKAQVAEQKARQAFNAPAATTPQLGAAKATNKTTTARASTTIASMSATTAPKTLVSGGAGASSASAKPAMPEQRRAPLGTSGLPSPTTQQAALAAPAPPRADPRSTSFGFGVPLRSTVGQAANLRAGAVQGHVALRPQVSGGAPPSTDDPTTPPWVKLPLKEGARGAEDRRRSRARPCGCAAPCRHRGGRRR